MTRPRSWPVTGTYRGEEITATFTATMERDWEGDPRVPNGTREIESIDPNSIECERVELLGKEIAFSRFPDEVQELISALADEIEEWK